MHSTNILGDYIGKLILLTELSILHNGLHFTMTSTEGLATI